VEEGRKEVVKRVKEIERKRKRKERQERRKNVIIKRMEVREGNRKKAGEEVFERIGIRVRIDEVKKLGTGVRLIETV